MDFFGTLSYENIQKSLDKLYSDIAKQKTYMIEYAIYRGTKVVVISKNYQNGEASVSEILPDGQYGPTFWVNLHDLKMLADTDSNFWAWDFGTPAQPKCECGSAKVYGLDGHHSSWCPAFKKENI